MDEKSRRWRQKRQLVQSRESLVWLTVPYILSLNDIFTLWQVWPLSISTEDQIWRYLLHHGHRFLSKENRPPFPSHLYEKEVKSFNAQIAQDADLWLPDREKFAKILSALKEIESDLIAAAECFREPEPRRYTNILEEWQGFHTTDDWADAGFMRQDFLNAGTDQSFLNMERWWYSLAGDRRGGWTC